MVIGKVQTAEKVPDGELLGHTGEDLPPSEQRESPGVDQTSSPELPEKGDLAGPWVFISQSYRSPLQNLMSQERSTSWGVQSGTLRTNGKPKAF